MQFVTFVKRALFGRALFVSGLLANWLIGLVSIGSGQQQGMIQFEIRDDRGAFVPCRIHLTNESGKPVFADGLPKWNDHFVCTGNVEVETRPGRYKWQIEKGPEYERLSGAVEVKLDRDAQVKAVIQRIANFRRRGWFSGDLHVHRAPADMELLLKAEDLDYAPVIEWWNQRGGELKAVGDREIRLDDGRMYELRAGEDEREGGALLFVGLDKPLNIQTPNREYPSPLVFVEEARKRNDQVWIDIEKPFWWDVPTWIATGEMDSIGVANNHMCRSSMLENEAWGRPRDSSRLASPLGNGYWTQEIYYHLLESGIRLPPSAGSASGVLPNPVGYNRVYVKIDADADSESNYGFERDEWFAALKKGRCFVTNGPLLEATSNNSYPGAVFRLPETEKLSISLKLSLTSNDPKHWIELIHNGQVVKRVESSREGAESMKMSLQINQPGWFLVRAIAQVDHTFRFASTAPWYIEGANGEKRLGRKSCQFFLRWIDERISRVQANVRDPAQLRSVLEPHEKARLFWLDRIEKSNSGTEQE